MFHVKRKRFRRRVYWIPNTSYGGIQFLNSANVAGNSNSSVLAIDLIGSANNAGLDVSPGGNMDRFGPRVDPDLIVKTLFGKMHWSVFSSPTDAAGGVWFVTLRQMILSVPMIPQQNIASQLVGNQQAVGAYQLVMPDAGATESAWALGGSKTPPGVQIFWTRTYAFVMNFNFGAGSSLMNSEQMVAPGSWVASHPNKRLKSAQQLFATQQISAGGISATGHIQHILQPDLKIGVSTAYPKRA